MITKLRKVDAGGLVPGGSVGRTLMVPLLIGTLLATLLAACSELPTPRYGVREGRLGDCLGEPGCVSSQAVEEEKRIDPFYYSVSRQEARALLMAVLGDLPRATVVSNFRNYIRVEFRNASSEGDEGDSYGSEAAIDDMEFYLQPGRKVIHVRAAPRLGSPESMENRERIRELIRRFHIAHNRHKEG